MLSQQLDSVCCSSCGGTNVRVVGRKVRPTSFAQQPAAVTRNYHCAECFHRWDVMVPHGEGSRAN